MEVTLQCLVLSTFGVVLLIAVIVLLGRLFRRPTLKDFANGSRRVFVTGTDTGFGRELALNLTGRLGVTVYAGCFTEEGERNLRADASSADLLKTIRLDVTDPASVDEARRYIEEDLRSAGIAGLWGLVNNAGIARGHIFHYSTLADYRAVMEVNFFAVVQITEAFLPLIIKCRGRIVNVISILSRCTGIAEPYSCSKYALQPYTDGLRRYLNTFGGHAASIEPGFFQTKLVDAAKLKADLECSWSAMTSEKRHLFGQEFHETAMDTLTNLTGNPPLAFLNRTSMVVESMIHALSAQRPKSRYVVGLDARFVYVPMGLMPDWFIDFSSRFMLPFHGLLARRVRLQQSHEEQATTTFKSDLPASPSSNKKEL